MVNKYYLKIQIDESNNASSKAVNDCNHILDTCGVKPYCLNIKKQGNKYIKKVNNFLQFEKINKIKKNSLLYVPHPLYVNKKYIDILSKAKKNRNIKLAFIIHDLDSLRKMFPDAASDFEYIDGKMYQIADYVISHNESMTEYLVDRGVDRNKIFNLEIFDYLTDTSSDAKEIKYVKTLNIAGNLDTNKCKYIKGLNRLNKDIDINLYGLNFDKKILDSSSIHYKGAFPADDIPAKLTEGFGLVWDGEGIDGCTGNTGDYLRYNNPHKLSLYLVSGLPVVIWSKAAEAKFVRKNNVGILVDSIDEFAADFDNISEQQYSEMLDNTKKIAEKLKRGAYLNSIVNKIDRQLNMI